MVKVALVGHSQLPLDMGDIPPDVELKLYRGHSSVLHLSECEAKAFGAKELTLAEDSTF